MKVIRGSELQFVPASHEDQDRPGVYKKVLAAKGNLQPGDVQMINWARLPPNAEFQRHLHEDMEEVFIIIRGRTEMVAGSQSAILEVGDAAVIAPGEPHLMRNLLSEESDYIVVGISGGRNGKTIIVP